MKILLLTVLLQSVSLFAAGGGGHYSPTDLIWPAVNLFGLIFLLIYLTKNAMSSYFTKNAEEVYANVESAKIQAQEVEKMIADQKAKTSNLDSELAAIKDSAQKELSEFEAAYKKETEEKIQKLKTDASSRIEAEKKLLLGNLNETLLDAVIANTKNKLNSDQTINTKATSKLLEGLK
jgi:F0F1-type ATP synthase membrane subunit b/b'